MQASKQRGRDREERAKLSRGKIKVSIVHGGGRLVPIFAIS